MLETDFSTGGEVEHEVSQFLALSGLMGDAFVDLYDRWRARSTL